MCFRSTNLKRFQIAIQKWWKFGAVAVGVSGGLFYAIDSHITYYPKMAIPSKLSWVHNKYLKGYDHASLRRGYEVYKQVCASCHSLKHIAYRHLVGVTHTESEAKAEAAKQVVLDGPDETGKMSTRLRLGQLKDFMTGPYKNDQQARYANNGYLPPDLTCIISGRKNGDDYIFQFLTNYTDPPAGISIDKDQHYNPYFRGGVIGMPNVIYDGLVDFADGTPASAPQMAKDVATFLKWTGDPSVEDMRKICLKSSIFTFIMIVIFFIALHLRMFMK